MPDKKEFAIGLISLFVILITVFFAGSYTLRDPVLHELIDFNVAVYDIAGAALLSSDVSYSFDKAEAALFQQLDPFSYHMNRLEYDEMVEEYSGQYGGIGLTIIPRDTTLMVAAVREGGPGYNAGIKSGDYIIAVGGKKISSSDPSAAIGRMRGPSGSSVQITLYRPELGDTISLTLTRSSIKLEHLAYFGMTEGGTAYIRLSDFDAGAAEDLRRAIGSLEKQNPTGYIIDLKGNPGGYLNEAIDAVDLFLDKGILIVGTSGRSRWVNDKHYSSGNKLTDRPVVVLTDKGTASAAEIFAGSLRGASRAVIEGDTTFGKGLVQEVFDLLNRDAVRLTVSRYYFADGRYLNPPDSALHYIGLAPDVIYSSEVPLEFQEFVLTRFLLYDFVEKEWERLKNYPDEFDYPDTVITLFEQFVRLQGEIYTSRMTRMAEATLLEQQLEQASPEILHQVRKLAEQSRENDWNAFRHWGKFVKYNIRRIALERKSGRAAAYRLVIVPGRDDIYVAAKILCDADRYRELLNIQEGKS